MAELWGVRRQWRSRGTGINWFDIHDKHEVSKKAPKFGAFLLAAEGAFFKTRFSEPPS